MEGWKFWWGIAAFFLGGLATQLNGWLTYRRQRKDRADDAADALRQRREEFELQHLVEVNEVLRACVRNLVDAMLTDWRNRGRPDHRVDEQMAEESMAASTRYGASIAELHSQIGFVLDDQVRQAVTEVAEQMDRMSSHPTFASDRMQILLGVHEAANRAYELLAARVRDLYAGRAGA